MLRASLRKRANLREQDLQYDSTAASANAAPIPQKCNSDSAAVIAARAQRPVAPDDVAGSPPCVDCNCSRRSASALPLLTFNAPESALPLSSTSTQRPPMWLPVLDGTQTMCFFPLFAAALACAADAGLTSKFSCVD